MIRYSVPVLVFMSVPVHVTSPVSEPVLYLFVCLNLYVAVAVAVAVPVAVPRPVVCLSLLRSRTSCVALCMRVRLRIKNGAQKMMRPIRKFPFLVIPQYSSIIYLSSHRTKNSLT